MKRLWILLALFVCFKPLITTPAPSIRMPQMTERSGDKKAIPKKRAVATSAKKSPRKKRKGVNGLKERHTISTMTYEELKKTKNKYKEREPLVAVKYLKEMIKFAENNNDKVTIEERAQLTIELADIYFSQKKYDEAKKSYQEFDRFYQGNKLIEYAKRQIIICASKGILGPDRDQTATEETLQLIKEYEVRFKRNEEINAIEKQCQTTLAQSEYGTIEFYIKAGDYNSAERRIQYTRKTWLEKVPETKITLAHLECDLGASWKEFKIPEESLKLVQATTEQTAKRNMTTRF